MDDKFACWKTGGDYLEDWAHEDLEASSFPNMEVFCARLEFV